jgi:hypothetical protein
MRGRPRVPRIAVDMSDDEPLRLTLEIRNAAPLKGTLGGDDAEPREFDGWIGLATAVSARVEEWEATAYDRSNSR